MTAIKVEAFDHAMHTAQIWVSEVAREFGTEDQQFAYRVRRFAAEAIISLPEVRRVAATVTAAIDNLMSPGQIEHVLEQLPRHLRPVLGGRDWPAED